MENNFQNSYQNNPQPYYKKRGIWKWIIIYLVAAIIIYALIYILVVAMGGGYGYNNQQYQYYQYNKNSNPSQTSGNQQDLNSISAELDIVNVDQIDTGLNQNDSDTSSF